MNKKKIFILILLIITAIYYLPIINLPLAPYDEAVILVGAERVLQGEVPFKDFFSVYPPGQVSLIAALFKVFGISVTVERVYDIVIKSLLSLCIFLIIRMLSSNKTAMVGWAMSLIWVKYSSFPAYPVYPAIFFTYLSVYFFLLHIERDKNYYIVLSAIFVIFSILFRHDLGGLAALVIAFALVLRRIIGVNTSWTPVVFYITSGVISGLPFIIYMFQQAAVGFMINDIILWPAYVFPKYQGLPYPSLSRYNLPFFVFPSVLLIGVITFLVLIKRKNDDTTTYGILLISLVGIVFFNQVRARSDTIHLLPVALSGILLSPILFHTLSRMLSLTTRLYWLFFGIFLIFFGITLSKPINSIILSMRSSYTLEIVNPDIEIAKYALISTDVKKTVSYIKKNTLKDEYIYVGVKNHDQFVFNDAIIYFLAERNCATKYHELNPGHTTTLEVQEEMVDELKSKNVRLVVLAARYRYEPNLSGIDTKIDLLDDYISNNYELKQTYGIYEIWMKKGVAFI